MKRTSYNRIKSIYRLAGSCAFGMVLAVTALLSAAMGAQRAETFEEALSKAGDDGVVAFCYAPDWNKYSVKLLKTFWNTPAAEAAAGNAVMVAVPFFQDSSSKGADAAPAIQNGLPSVPHGTYVCPAVMMIDKSGNMYAYLPGADFLGNDETCTLGCKNIKEKLGHLRKRIELLAKAESLVGTEKAKLLAEVADLPITQPADIVQQIELADPTDKTGAVRRNKFSALQCMYKLLDTTDGFLKPDYEPDYDKIRQECEAVMNDKSYRAKDRQAVYALYVGESRRQLMSTGRPTPNQLKGIIKKGMQADESTNFGRLSPTLEKLWGGLKFSRTSEQRKADREKKSEDAKNKKEKKRMERNAEKNIDIS